VDSSQHASSTAQPLIAKAKASLQAFQQHATSASAATSAWFMSGSGSSSGTTTAAAVSFTGFKSLVGCTFATAAGALAPYCMLPAFLGLWRREYAVNDKAIWMHACSTSFEKKCILDLSFLPCLVFILSYHIRLSLTKKVFKSKSIPNAVDRLLLSGFIFFLRASSILFLCRCLGQLRLRAGDGAGRRAASGHGRWIAPFGESPSAGLGGLWRAAGWVFAAPGADPGEVQSDGETHR